MKLKKSIYSYRHKKHWIIFLKIWFTPQSIKKSETMQARKCNLSPGKCIYLIYSAGTPGRLDPDISDWTNLRRSDSQPQLLGPLCVTHQQLLMISITGLFGPDLLFTGWHDTWQEYCWLRHFMTLFMTLFYSWHYSWYFIHGIIHCNIHDITLFMSSIMALFMALFMTLLYSWFYSIHGIIHGNIHDIILFMVSFMKQFYSWHHAWHYSFHDIIHDIIIFKTLFYSWHYSRH